MHLLHILFIIFIIFSSAAFDFHLSVAILRVPEGLDFTGLIADCNVVPGPVVISAVSPSSGANESTSALTPNVSSATLNPVTLKPSASSASGWTNADGKNLSRSQESLHSQGNYSEMGSGITNQFVLFYWQITMLPSIFR
jgi:hypothetical protein